uniref:Uncharacterized protein n=1 Tax=Caenorhabditis japonica TaxID=281687 RepID=A0A8R1EES2_CAEJA
MFVANRLHAIRVTSAEMEEHTTVQFGHVRTKENPADIGTRGCDKHAFSDSIWWNEPEFIKNDSSKWDVNSFKLIYENEPVVMMNAAKREHEDTTETVFDCSRTMKFTQTKRVAAWELRFIRRCAKKSPGRNQEKI